MYDNEFYQRVTNFHYLFAINVIFLYELIF